MDFVHLLVLALGCLYGGLAVNMLVGESPLLAWSLLDYEAFCPMVFGVVVAAAVMCSSFAVDSAVGVSRDGLRIVSQSTIWHICRHDGVGGVVRHLLTPAHSLYTWAYSWYCRLASRRDGKIAAVLVIPTAILAVSYRIGLPIMAYSLGLFAALDNSSGEPSVNCHYHGDKFISTGHYRSWGSQIQKFWCDGERDGLDALVGLATAKEAHLYNWELFQLISIAGLLAAVTLYTFVAWLVSMTSLPDSFRAWIVELAEAFVTTAAAASDGERVGAPVNIEQRGKHGADNGNTTDNIIAMLTPLVGINRELEASNLVSRSTVEQLEREALSRGQDLDAIRETNKELRDALANAEAVSGRLYPQLRQLEEENAATRQSKHERWHKANPCGVLSKPRFKRVGRFQHRLMADVVCSLENQPARAPRFSLVTPDQHAFAATRVQDSEQALAIVAIEDRLRESLAEVGRLEDECSERKLAASNLEAKLSEKALVIAALEAQRGEQELVDTELRNKNSREAGVADGVLAKDAHAAVEPEIEAELREQVASLQDLVDDRSQEVLQMDRMLLSLTIKSEGLEAECERAGSELSRAKGQIEALSTCPAEAAGHDEPEMDGVVTDDPEKTQLRHQVAISETRAQVVGAELARVKTLLTQRQAEFDSMKANHGPLTEGTVTRDYQIQDLQSLCQGLRKEVNELRQQLGQSRSNAVQQQDLADANLRAFSLQSERDDLQRQLDLLRQSSESSQQDQAKQVIDQLRKKLEATERANVNDKIASTKKIAKLEGDLRNVKISQSNQSASTVNPRVVRNPLRKVLDDVRKELDDSKAELQTLRTAHGPCEGTQATLQAQLDAVKAKLAELDPEPPVLTGVGKRARSGEEEAPESASKRQKESEGGVGEGE